MKEKKIILMIGFLICLSSLNGCIGKSESDRVQSSVVVPLLGECTDYIRSFLDNLPEAVGVSYSMVKFDYELRAIPTLEGYVEVRATTHTEEQLMTLVNTFTLNCYPESHTKIDKKHDNVGEQLTSTLAFFKRLGILNIYIVDTNDEVSIFVHRDIVKRGIKTYTETIE